MPHAGRSIARRGLGLAALLSLAWNAPAALAQGTVEGHCAASQIDVVSYQAVHDQSLYTHDGDNRGWGPEHDLARNNIESLFASYGLVTSLDPFQYGGSTFYNVVGELPGTTRPDEVYIVGGHYDSVSNPGADDDASGVAGVLEIARLLSQWPSEATIRFVAFDREEQGLRGSSAYATEYRFDDIRGMVQLDMIAYPVIDVTYWAELYGRSESNPLKYAVSAALADYAHVSTYIGGRWDVSDHAPFESQGFQATFVFESGTNPYYHTQADSVDTPNYIDYDYAIALTRGVTGWLVDAAGVKPPGITSFPFFDDFPVVTIDGSLWTSVDGATVNGDGIGEPSGSLSLNLDGSATGGDEIQSAVIDRSSAANVVLSYWYQRTGGGDSPEPGDDLVVEYYDDDYQWVEINRHPGDGPDGQPFAYVAVTLPLTAHDVIARIRFRCISSDVDQDDWFVDDISLAPGDVSPPLPDPAIFSIPPTPVSTSQIIMQVSQAVDADSPPVEYWFDAVVPSGAGASDSPWQSSLDYTDSGLSPNSLYTYRVQARDSATPTPNATGYSTAITTATYIETPAGVAFGAVGDDTIELQAPGSFSYYPAEQTGFYFDCLDAGCDGGINAWLQYAWQEPAPIPTDVATGLSPDTFYEFRVKARNRVGIETAWSPTAGKATRAAVPAAPVLTGATESTLDLDVSPNGNPSYTLFAIRCVGTNPSDANWDGMYVDALGAASASAVWQTDGTWGTITVWGLQAGTQYTFAVQAMNQEGVETSFGPSASLTTSTGGGCGTLLGDVDGSGVVDGLDIAGYVRVKLGVPEPGDETACADYATGTLDGDTAAFVADLLGA